VVRVHSVQIDFEDGFRGDTVIVSAAGRELWREEDVTTNLAANVAAIARVEVPGEEQLEVIVPTRGLSTAARVETPFLVVRIEGERLLLEPSEELPIHL
jgi:hypothetical protein